MSIGLVSKQCEYIRSVSVTALSTVLSISVALISAIWGISEIHEEDKFETQHYLFVSFMTWRIPLTAEAS
ncbi:hypothetical protein DV706_20990 (plasmid) [Natronorubrum bangense]|uniref:Uncharacterized protein n=2 Tax=Natronorubrum bangense TaxID=61858 RepID=L9WIA2_9EURY|nr:hypothetical protein C494_08837 [Natronorubrum bangense JCM 10635]QCC57002.1 hypothetical protein DV706_20990 [Natronorubrum bangense]